LNTHDLQLERAEDLLKGILLVAQHNSTAKRAALK
jgi:hypothetical protein